MYNIYFKTNNIIFLNLKKKKIKVQAYVISWKKIQFSYNFLEINGLKKNSISLTKKFLIKKLSVFFISNLNMVESKWYLLKTYNLYYNKFIYKKKRNNYLFIYTYLINSTYNNIYKNNFFLNKKKKIMFINIIKMNYFYKWKNSIIITLQCIKNIKNINLFFKHKKKLISKNFFLKKLAMNNMLYYNNLGFKLENIWKKKKKKKHLKHFKKKHIFNNNYIVIYKLYNYIKKYLKNNKCLKFYKYFLFFKIKKYIKKKRFKDGLKKKKFLKNKRKIINLIEDKKNIQNIYNFFKQKLSFILIKYFLLKYISSPILIKNLYNSFFNYFETHRLNFYQATNTGELLMREEKGNKRNKWLKNNISVIYNKRWLKLKKIKDKKLKKKFKFIWNLLNKKFIKKYFYNYKKLNKFKIYFLKWIDIYFNISFYLNKFEIYYFIFKVNKYIKFNINYIFYKNFEKFESYNKFLKFKYIYLKNFRSKFFIYNLKNKKIKKKINERFFVINHLLKCIKNKKNKLNLKLNNKKNIYNWKWKNNLNNKKNIYNWKWKNNLNNNKNKFKWKWKNKFNWKWKNKKKIFRLIWNTKLNKKKIYLKKTSIINYKKILKLTKILKIFYKNKIFKKQELYFLNLKKY